MTNKSLLFITFSLLFGLLLGQVVLGGSVGADTEPPVTIKTLLSQDRIRPGDHFQMAVVFEIASGYHIYGAEEKIGTPMKVTILPTDGLIIENPIYPVVASHQEWYHPEFGKGTYSEKPIVIIPIMAMQDIPLGEKQIDIRVTYGACTEMKCLPPVINRPFTVSIEVVSPDTAVHPINQDIFSTRIDPTSEVGPKQDLFTRSFGKGFLWALLAAFLGGILASLTPCVYPMIPITVAYFASQTGQSRVKIFLMSLIYVLGIAITYSSLGLVVALSGRAFGSILGNPYIVTAIAIFFIVLGLSMFDVIEFRLPYFITGKLGTGKRGLIGALFMGLLLGVIAAPCVGPILIGILTWIGKQGNPILGFSFLFSFALGMGVLFIVLAVFSNALNALPRSGVWMVGVRKFFGVLLFAVAVYFISPLTSITVISVIMGVLLALFSLYIFWSLRKSSARGWLVAFSTGLGIVSIILALFFTFGLFIPEGKGFPTPLSILSKKTRVKWIYDVREGLEIARQERRPVIIDFGADWCVPCKIMDATTFADEEIVKELRRFVAIKVDCTRAGEPEEKLLKEYGLKGVPAFVFYDSSGNYLKPKTVLHKIDTASLLQILKEIE